jgi:hypothetical protein
MDYVSEETIHGVAVQLLIGSEKAFGANYLLAILPGRTTWILMAAPGASQHTALAQAYRILSTLQNAPGASARPPSSPIREAFVGQWEVHDALLDITSGTTGVITAEGSCLCEERDYLALSMSSNGAQMNAVVTKVIATGVKGRVVADPDPNEAPGQKLFFQFMEPHLMLEVTIPNERRDFGESFGNPYWCGKGLARYFSNACGL